LANRSYLYATNVVPTADPAPATRKRIGISEWGWETPLVYKLLLSGDPRVTPSTLWRSPHNLAIVGDYAKGVDKLRAFLARIELPEAQPQIAEALAFLDADLNRLPWLVLECGELYELEDEDMGQLNARMHECIQQIDGELDAVLETLQPDYRGKPGSEHDTPQEALAALGLGQWSNVLYFDLSDG
jgi:hypothetical protein